MKRDDRSSPKCSHGRMLSCPACVLSLILCLLEDLEEILRATDCTGFSEFRDEMRSASARLPAPGLVLRADARPNSEIERRLRAK